MRLRPGSEAMLFGLGVALLPVYVFESGGVQPGHMVFACFFILSFLRHGLPLPFWAVLLAGMFMHSFFVEGAYAMMGRDPRHLIHSAFFLYNFILSAAIYGFVRRNGLGALVPGLTCAALLALAPVLASGVDLRELQETGRPTGMFNNPNQLGYFSVCLLSLTYLLYRHGAFSYLSASALFSIALFLSVSSLSKAAMIANFVVIFVALKPTGSRYALILWALGVSVAIAALLWFNSRGAFDEYLFMQRLDGLSEENDSSLVSRGYFAFFEANAIQLLVGLGHANVDDIVGREVHSTLGSVINSYGLVGLGLFGGLLVIWGCVLWRMHGFVGLFCIAGPAMLYGITHNGTRFTIFWLLVAVSFAMARQEGGLAAWSYRWNPFRNRSAEPNETIC